MEDPEFESLCRSVENYAKIKARSNPNLRLNVPLNDHFVNVYYMMHNAESYSKKCVHIKESLSVRESYSRTPTRMIVTQQSPSVLS